MYLSASYSHRDVVQEEQGKPDDGKNSAVWAVEQGSDVQQN